MSNKSISFEGGLVVWQKAHQFVLRTYELTKSFPKSEMYGLTNQFRRASVSIPANIAEGYKKKSSKDLNYKEDISKEIDLLIEVSKLLNAYCKAILNSITS